jgi:uncharacterized protein (TIGR00251 family)
MTKSQELLVVNVKPRAAHAGVEVAKDGRVVVRVHAPAAEGAANRECLATLAAALGVPKTSLEIVRGEKSRAKQIAVAHLTAAEVRERLPRGRGAS